MAQEDDPLAPVALHCLLYQLGHIVKVVSLFIYKKMGNKIALDRSTESLGLNCETPLGQKYNVKILLVPYP